MIVADYEVSYIGNLELLKKHKSAFLCSREVAAEVVLKCYDWSIAMRDQGRCVISGFHSTLEKDVLHYLLKGKQPVIMVLARSMKSKWEARIQKALEEGRLLIISPFDEKVKRASEHSAAMRNDLMIKLAEEIIVGYAREGGMLERRLRLEFSKLVQIL